MVGCVGEHNLNSEASQVKHFQLFCSFTVSEVSGIDRYKILDIFSPKQSWVGQRPSKREFRIRLTRSKPTQLLCVWGYINHYDFVLPIPIILNMIYHL